MDKETIFSRKRLLEQFKALRGAVEEVLRPSLDKTERKAILSLFGISLIAGVLFKILLAPFLTIGWDDYRLSDPDTLLRLNEIQEEVLRSGGSLALTSSDLPEGERCINPR